MSDVPSGLQARIDADLKQAMRDRNETAKLTLRAVKTAFMQARTSGNVAHDISDADAIEIIRREAKRRRDAADEFQRVGALARAEAELAEHAILQSYLPQPLSDSEIEAIAQEVIAEFSITSIKQMGQVIQVVLTRTAARADGKSVHQIVRRLLTP